LDLIKRQQKLLKGTAPKAICKGRESVDMLNQRSFEADTRSTQQVVQRWLKKASICKVFTLLKHGNMAGIECFP
jgi:hypothetical protein